MDNSGYTSITVDGEQINLRFGIPAVRMFLEKISTDEVLISNNTINEVGISSLIYCGYINNCMVKDEVPVKTQGFFLEFVENGWINEGVKKQLINVSNVYASSKFTKKVLENVQEHADGIKKKEDKQETDWDLIESFCLFELGLSVKEYYSLTLRQFELMSDGYRRSLEIKRAATIDSWRQTRLIAYLSIKENLKDKNLSIYDFYPLPNDPTKEQVLEQNKIDQEQEGKRMKKIIDDLRKQKIK